MIYHISKEELSDDHYKIVVQNEEYHLLCVFEMPVAEKLYVDFVSACRDRKITLIQTDIDGNEIKL